MKKIFFMASAGIVLFIAACNSSGGSDPKTTLLNFFDALSRQDFKAARKYATKESEQMFSLMEMAMQMAKTMKAEETEAKFKEFGKENLEVGETRIDGDKAYVNVRNKKENSSADFILKKEGGAWKVAFDQQTMSEMAGEQMRKKGMDNSDGIDSVQKAIQNMNVDSLKLMMEKSKDIIDSFNKVNDALKEKH